MKRFAILFLLLALLCAVAESEMPQADEGALELVKLLSACPSLMSFEETPEAELSREAVALYRRQFPYTELTDAEIYSLIFAHGELNPEVYSVTEFLPVEIEPEDACELPGNELKLSCIARQDEGDGFEFAFLADFYLVPSTRSPFGWLVDKVFFPE